MSALDLAAIRARFPALSRRQGTHPVAYFDGPGGTQVPAEVASAMDAYLFEHNANTHWAYPSSAETDRILADAKSALGAFLGCAAEEVAFGANMTSLVFHFTRALRIEPGDVIITTRLDHQANVAPWHRLAKERGAQIREIAFDLETGVLDMDALEQAIDARTRWIALGAASNALGTITDVARVRPWADAVGARVFVDAVHFAAHHRIDVRRMGADALACSPYKFYGPHMGTLWASSDVLAELDPPRLECAGDIGAEILETGTLSHEGIAGSAAAVEFIASLGDAASEAPLAERLDAAFDVLEARGAEVASRLGHGLAAIDGVAVYGPEAEGARTTTFGFTVRGRDSEEVTRELAERWGVFTSHGDFYATTVIEDLGLAPDGLVRAGAACFTTDEEIDRLLEGVASLVR